LKSVREALRKDHPQIAIDSEDAAEPYMHLLDGYLPWRFVYVVIGAQQGLRGRA